MLLNPTATDCSHELMDQSQLIHFILEVSIQTCKLRTTSQISKTSHPLAVLERI